MIPVHVPRGAPEALEAIKAGDWDMAFAALSALQSAPTTVGIEPRASRKTAVKVERSFKASPAFKEGQAEKPKKVLAPSHIAAMQAGREARKEAKQVENAQAEREAAQNKLSSMRERYAKATEEDDKAYQALVKAGGSKKAPEKVFLAWVRANGILLNYSSALHSTEKAAA